MSGRRVIWQYWETRGTRPAFVDGLHEIAKRNSGCEVVQVTPETLGDYLGDIPPQLAEIRELAHKADMIRAMLICRHGGMWLDSDAIVLSDLNWLFDLLSRHEFVGFNDAGLAKSGRLNVRINCFLSRPGSEVMRRWVAAQHAKFPRTEYAWTEVGTDLLDPIVRECLDDVRLLPFDMVCPVRWNEVERFSSRWENAARILDRSRIVMLSNKALHMSGSDLPQKTVEELAEGGTLIADIVKRAIDPGYRPPGLMTKAVRAVFGGFIRRGTSSCR